MNNNDIKRTIGHLGDCELDIVPQKVQVAIPNARENLRRVLAYMEPRLQWLPEYDEVARWLAGNDGRGLLCMGNLGRGKTLVAARAVPVLLNHFRRLIVRVVGARELNASFDAIKRLHIICVDDIGTESEQVRYGERRVPFAELVDDAEKKGKLLLLTTNLTVDELAAKYGARTVDRLRAITRIVLFKGESMRCRLESE